jgi:hypothetical protein
MGFLRLMAPAQLSQLLETLNLYPARHLSDSCGSLWASCAWWPRPSCDSCWRPLIFTCQASVRQLIGFLRLVAPAQLLRQLLETFNLYPARHLSGSCGS